MTETATQVERVARAIYCAENDIIDGPDNAHVNWWFNTPDEGYEYVADDYRKMATAAIKAMSDAEPVACLGFYFPIEMPLTASGLGPAEIGKDAVKMTYEVWDQHCESHGSHELLVDAIRHAAILNERMPVAAPQPHTAPIPHEQGRDEVERLREALEQIVRWDQQREWTATAENPETHWVTRDGQCAKIARAALSLPLS